MKKFQKNNRIKKTKKMEMSNAIISTFKNNNYDYVSAISEFVDNSTQSFFDNKKELLILNGNPRIDIIFDKKSHNGKVNNSIYINDNAYGMSPDTLLESLDIGKKLKNSSRNEFGMGLKTSAFWFCSEWAIYTKTPNSKVTNFVSVKEEEAIKDGYEFVIEETPSEFMDYNSGTEISLDVFQKNRRMTINSLEKLSLQLASVYRQDIERENLEIRVVEKKDDKYRDISMSIRKEHNPDEEMWKHTLNEIQPLSWKDPEIKVSKDEEIKAEFTILLNDAEGEELVAKTKIWSLAKGDRKMSGMTFIRNGRVVEGGYNEQLKPRVLFGAPNSFESLRIYIVVDVGSNWQVSQQKDRLLISEEVREELYSKIKEKSKQILKFAREDRGSPSLKTISKNLNKKTNISIREKINQITDLLDVSQNNISITMETIDDLNSKWFVKIWEKADSDQEYTEYIINTKLLVDPKKDLDWLTIRIDNDNEDIYNFEMNLAHHFFGSYSEDKKYLDLLQRMMFYILFAEFLVKNESKVMGKININSFRKYLNRLFANEVK